MAFSDPIVGTEVLIRNQIQSENFSSDPAIGVTGWQIKKDGTATFNNLVVGAPGYSVGPGGDAVFHSITLTAQPNETGIILHGDDIDPELYNHKARGIVKWIDLNGTGPVTTVTSDTVFARSIIPALNLTRAYRIDSLIHINVNATQPTYVGIRCRYAWDTDPTTTSAILFEHQWGGRGATATDQFSPVTFVFRPEDLGTTGTNLHILLSTFSSVAGINVQAETWDRFVVSDAGELVPIDAYDMGVGGGSPPTQYTKTYNPTFSESYQSDGTSRGSFDNGDVYQGYYSATNGNQFSMIGFPYSTISADLTGATINKVEVYLDNTHWYNNSGGTAVIGYHNNATAPSTATYPTTDNITRSTFTYGQAKWVTVNNSIGTAFQNGTAKGILLGKGQTSGGTLSNDHTYYGYFAGATKTGKPLLRITYTK